MGCICSKGTEEEDGKINDNARQPEVDKSSVQLVAPIPSKKEEVVVDVSIRKDGSVRPVSKANVGSANVPLEEPETKAKVVDKPTKSNHGRSATMDFGSRIDKQNTNRIISMPHGSEGELMVAGWPQWLTAAAGEAIKGWLPRRADSFEKLDKVSIIVTRLSN